MKSQDRFSDLSNTEALDLVAIELSFLYDYLHTKAVHMHSILGRTLRYFSLFSIIAALVVFHHLDMQKYVSGDIIITYILFGVGLSLEVIATIFLVFSDWSVVALKRTQHSECVVRWITTFLKAISKKGKPRWARTIGHFNLVDFSLRDRDTIGRFYLARVLAKIMRILKIKNKWNNMRESKLTPFQNELVEIMVTEAKRRAQNVHIYNVLVEARAYRGNKTLERHNQLEKLEWSMKREFDESIILWHLATDICYYEDTSKSEERDVSWKTSNYMIYLLTQQQSMMQLGYGKTRFEATCSVVKKKLKDFKVDKKPDYKKIHDELKKNDEARLGLEQNDTSDDGREHGWRCWGKRKGKEDKRKNEESPPVPEHTNAPVPDDGHQPGWRCWGKRKGKEDKRKNEEAPPVPEQNEEAAPAEHTNALVPDDGHQLGWRCWGKGKGKEDKRKNEEAPPVPAQNEEAAPAEHTNALVPDDGHQLGWRCWGKRKSKDQKAKLKDQEEMGKLVIKDSIELAKRLQAIKPDTKKWELISETWMEMLGYAAIHCDSYQHAKSLSRGGELLTHLWLLMSQLGVVEEHKMQQYQSGTV